MAVIKRYEAHVALDMVDYFMEELEKRKDNIRIVRIGLPMVSKEGTVLYRTFMLEAERGTIDPKYEIGF